LVVAGGAERGNMAQQDMKLRAAYEGQLVRSKALLEEMVKRLGEKSEGTALFQERRRMVKVGNLYGAIMAFEHLGLLTADEARLWRNKAIALGIKWVLEVMV
jgi:hypothetical protein